MKKILNLILFAFVPVLLSAQGITFEHGSFKEALAKAKAQNKILFIDGYAVWCGPCKVMANTVFMEPVVGKYFDENLIALKVDVERGEGPAIKRKYGISGLPGYVFIDGDGNVVYRFEAAMPTDKFLEKVKLAVKYSKDPNSVGRLAESYEKLKNDEKFLRMYLDKLNETHSVGYVDAVEQYLKIQKSMSESSKEMVLFLAGNSKELIFGGLADSILQRNNGSEEWKKWVRKDIREMFQKIPRMMVENTTNYAVAKRDTAILELVLSRADEAGVNVDSIQRNKLYIYYYEQTAQGDKYKSMIYDNNDAYINSIDIQKLRNYYLNWLDRKSKDDAVAKRERPNSMKVSQQIAVMVFSYAKFATTEKDKSDVIRWMKVAYDIIPGDCRIMSQYATIIYLFRKDKSEALKIKEEALKIATEQHDKFSGDIAADLDLMKKGEKIVLK